MKLTTKTGLSFISLSAIFFLLGSVFMYFAVRVILADDLSSRLYQMQKDFIQNLSNDLDINNLSNKDINKLLRKNSNYDYDAISFNLIPTGQTFIAINGSKDGFQSNRDLLVDITGFKGDINNLNITTGIDPNYPLI